MKRVLFLMIVLLTAGMVSAQQKEASITVVGDAVHNFGEIKQSDGDASHTFTVINNGELPLVISRVAAPCGCTTPEFPKEPIAPGKTGDITVTYHTTGRPGPFNSTVSIYSNGSKGNYVLTVRGDVK